MNTWRCMIVDDEPIAIRVLKRHLAKMKSYDIVKCSSNARESIRYLSDFPVDLLLLDIEMPELSGIQLYKSLKIPPALIMTTAHRDYAVEGFELNAIDYLLKPVSFPRLAEALHRFEESQTDSGSLNPEEYLFVTVDRIKRKINLNEIIYIESLKDYIRITTTKEILITKETTTDFEQRLPADTFLRIHRSFIVNIHHIDTVSHSELTLGQTTLPVGRTYKKEVMKSLGVT